SLRKSMIIARREYLTTVRRKAFVVSLLLTPAILFLSGFLSNKLANDDARKRYAEARIVALVDSSGLYRDVGAAYMYQPQPDAPPDPRQAMKPVVMPPPIPVILRRYDSQTVALDSLLHGNVKQVLTVSSDFLQNGRLRLYEHDTRAFTQSGDDRPLRVWLTRKLLTGQADSAHIERVLGLGRNIAYYTLVREGHWTSEG